MRTTILRGATALIATTILLSGCLPGGDDSSGGDKQQTSSGAVTGNPEDGAKEAGIDLTNPPAAIAKATFAPTSQQDITKTTIELLELKRSDNVMLATFRLTGEGRGNEAKTASQLLDNNSFDPVFLDMKKLEKYSKVNDLTSSLHQAQAPLGDPVYVFTAFPLPRDGVTSMDLQMTGSSPTITDVPMPQ